MDLIEILESTSNIDVEIKVRAFSDTLMLITYGSNTEEILKVSSVCTSAIIPFAIYYGIFFNNIIFKKIFTHTYISDKY